MSIKWSDTKAVLQGFGGQPVDLSIHKTGLPFFDALLLYGAIDLYIGLREDVVVHDSGDKWCITSRSRQNRIKGRDENAYRQVRARKRSEPEDYCSRLRRALTNGTAFQEEAFTPATKDCSGVDSALQAGIRDVAATSYKTLQTSQTSESTCCVAKIPLAQGLLAFAGKKRVEVGVGNITFLPIFEGQIDLSKVVSPIRARVGVPNVLCSQALVLLILKNSLFADGYEDRLTAVAFNTNLGRQRSDNYSGLIRVDSTAIGRIKSPSFAAQVYRTFRGLIEQAWEKKGKKYGTTALTPDALAMAYWLMQPVGKHLSAVTTSQERLYRRGYQHIFSNAEYVKEVFEMTYKGWEGDLDAVRKFAKAVASAIYYARMKGADDPRKNWYDEVTMLRSAPSAKAFIERAMILIEQGHREHSQVGTKHRDEAFDPQALFSSIGDDHSSFEAFRNLFRMYLVQESTYQGKGSLTADGNAGGPSTAVDPEVEPEKEGDEE